MKQIALSELQEIFKTYKNGNISDAKEAVKKLSKQHRKTLYQQVAMGFGNEQKDFISKDALFFFNLI
jgi:hypothetical protein